VKNAGKNRNIKISDKLSECVSKLKNLGTILMNQKYLQENIKSSLNLENACYSLHQNLLFSGLLPKNMKIKILQNLICFLLCTGIKFGLSH